MSTRKERYEAVFKDNEEYRRDQEMSSFRAELETIKAGQASLQGERDEFRSCLATASGKLMVAEAQVASLQKELAERTVERDAARRKLFPYADATEISGYSTTGIYLIGDRKSIKAAEKAFHYSTQIDEYRTAFDERIKAAESRADALAQEEERLRELVQKAFKDGVLYGTNVDVSDVWQAWLSSKVREELAALKQKDGGNG